MPAKPAPKKEEPAKKEEAKPAAAAEAAPAAQKAEKGNAKRNTKKKKAFMPCTRLKATKFLGHVQLVSGVVQDTSWQITMTDTLAVTAVLHATSRNKISSFKSSNCDYSFLTYHA